MGGVYMHNKVLIVEDDSDIASKLIIKTINVPKMDGYSLIKEVRKFSNIPIIIISAKTADMDKVLGLKLGADAYITKPFNPLELVAYVKALLRRYYEFKSSNNEINTLNVGELSLDLSKYIFMKNNKIVPLTSTEIKILAMMMKSPGKVFTRSQIYECINGDFYDTDDNTMMVHISNIRGKIENNPAKPEYIKTVRGLGYKLENKEEL